MLTPRADTENTNKTLVLNENDQLKRFILIKTIKTISHGLFVFWFKAVENCSALEAMQGTAANSDQLQVRFNELQTYFDQLWQYYEKLERFLF